MNNTTDIAINEEIIQALEDYAEQANILGIHSSNFLRLSSI